MNIPPLSGPVGVVPAVPSPEELTRGAGNAAGPPPEVRRIEPVQPTAPSEPAKETDKKPPGLGELRSVAERAQLELRIESLPDSDVTLIRIVEPRTGEVVREFPPENLAKELTELRRLAAARFDRRA